MFTPITKEAIKAGGFPPGIHSSKKVEKYLRKFEEKAWQILQLFRHLKTEEYLRKQNKNKEIRDSVRKGFVPFYQRMRAVLDRAITAGLGSLKEIIDYCVKYKYTLA